MATLGQLIVQIGADISNFSEGIAQVQNGVLRLAGAPVSAMGGLTGAFVKGVGGVLNFAESVGRTFFLVSNLARGIAMVSNVLIGQNAMLEQAQVAFTGLLHSGTAAHTFLMNLYNFAARTPFLFPDLLAASQRMLAVGVSRSEEHTSELQSPDHLVC